MRHVSRTHRVALDWLLDRINLDSKIHIKYIDTKNQLVCSDKNHVHEQSRGMICLYREFPREKLKNFHTLRIFVFLHGLMIWRVLQRNVWNDIASWRTKRLNNSTKYQLHALTTITSKKKKRNLLEIWHMYALKLF